MNRKALFLILLLLLSFIINNEEKQQASSFLMDDERLEAIIQIESDNDFILLGLNGSGTESDPYIIEDVVIETQDKGGIYISDTSKSCTIRNCTILSKQFGIYIEDLAEGKIIIQDNYLNVSEFGIYLMNINGATIRNNECTDSKAAITLFRTINVIVRENNCSFNEKYGIDLNYVEQSSIEYNYCINNTYGITTFYCSNLDITNNICNYNGHSDPDDLEGRWDYGDGIRIGYSDYCRVKDNNCTKNIIAGLSYLGGDFFIAYNNTIKSNKIGIEMLIEHSGHLVTEIVSGVALVYNKIINNTEYGIWLLGFIRQSHIHHNVFIDNNLNGTPLGLYSEGPPYGYSQARENTRRRNIWYDKETNVGNYWSNYQNEDEYLIDGNETTSFNSDPFPVSNLSEMNIPPMPDFPKGMWLTDQQFILIRVAFAIIGFLCIPIALIVLSKIVSKSRKKRPK